MFPCSNLLRTLSPHSPLFPLPIHTASPLPPRLTSVRPLHCSDPNRNPNKEFDPVQFESERLRLDEKARNTMAAEAAVVGTSSGGEKQWKWRIRKRVWDMMEAEGIARNPRPVHHRIPNFEGAVSAADALGKLEVFEKAKCVKVNPDSPQKQVRFLTLTGGKMLLTPQPRLRTGFFSVLVPHLLPAGSVLEACTSVGAAKYGKPIDLDEKIIVDLLVIGSVAVDPNTGARLGKGEGFAELEYGMLRYMGAISDSTMVVTTGGAIKSEQKCMSLDATFSCHVLINGESLHDKQLVDDIPVEKLLVHDVPVDIVCTPTQVIFTNTAIPKPQGIYWEKLSPEKLGQIRILRELKRRIEKETGTKLPCGPSEKLPPTAKRGRR